MFEVQNMITSMVLGFNSYVASTAASSSFGGATVTTYSPAVDLGPFVEANKRPVKCVCIFVPSAGSSVPSTVGTTAQFYLYGATSSNGTFATVSTASTGGTITLTSTYNSVGAFTEFAVVSTFRYVTGYATVGSSAAGQSYVIGMAVQAFSRAV